MEESQQGTEHDLPPTLTNLLGWTPWRSLGLLPVKFPGLQGRPKHSGAACEESEGAAGHGPFPSIHTALWVATLEDSEAATWEFTSLQWKPKDPWEIPGRSSRVPPTCTKLFRYLPWCRLGLLPRTSAPSTAGQNTWADAWEESWGATAHGPASHCCQQSMAEHQS